MAELGLNAALLIVWTLVIRVFPSVLGTAFEKRIAHGYDNKLEKIKAEYSTLKTSVDFLSTTQSELRAKVIESTETLWSALLDTSKEFTGVRAVDTLLTPKEINEILSGERENPVIQEFLKPYSDAKSFTDKLTRYLVLLNEKDRLFVGDRLWILGAAIVAIHGQCGFLMQKSIEQKQYFSWKDDETVNSFLKSHLSEDVIGKAKAMKLGGLNMIFAHLGSDFLKEAARVMSGSQGFADSLSDLNSVLQYQNQQIQQQLLKTP